MSKDKPTGQAEMDLGVRFRPPTLVEAIDWGLLHELPAHECEKFHAYYQSNGWKVGRNKMKSWRDAMTHWKLVWLEGQKPRKSRSALEYKIILDAKQRIADEIRKRYFLDVAGGGRWTDQNKKVEYAAIKSDIKRINEQIAGMNV